MRPDFTHRPAPPERPSSLDDVFAEALPALVRSVLPLVRGQRAVAEDVVAEAFTRAQPRWDQIREYDRPDLWLRRVAINLAISYQRKEGRVHRAGLNPYDGIENGTTSPPTAEVLDLVMALPKRQAQVVVLVHFARESVTEAARILDISESTARTHLARALAHLAHQLTDQENSHEHPDG